MDLPSSIFHFPFSMTRMNTAVCVMADTPNAPLTDRCIWSI